MIEKKILKELFSKGKNSDKAWREFLHSYSKLILKIIWRYTHDYDEAMSKYLFVCSSLCKNDFKVMKKFEIVHNRKKTKLAAWLTVVVNHLCIDEYRIKEGRKRHPKAILSLNDFDKKVFELYYWKGYEISQIEQYLNLKSDEINELTESLDRITDVISPGFEKKRLDKRKPYFVEFKDYHLNDSVKKQSFDMEELAEKLGSWVDKLPEKEKLIVKFKYWENFSAPAISKIMNISERQVYSILEKTLKDLREFAKKDSVNF